MPGIKRAGALGGWALAEVMCCVLFVSVVALCVVETAGMSARLSDGVRLRGAMSAELRSIIGETARAAESVDVARGEWVASVGSAAHFSGMSRADVSVSPSRASHARALAWRLWEIGGRSR
jgi:hypothetical protein